MFSFCIHGTEYIAIEIKIKYTKKISTCVITVDSNIYLFGAVYENMLTNDGRCTCEIKPRIAMAKAEFYKKRDVFSSKMDLELRK
jgi:hypothetical protein